MARKGAIDTGENMSTKKQYGKDEYKPLLERAIQENISISVSLKTHTQCYICSSRFQGMEDDLICFVEPNSRVIDPRNPIQEVFITFSRDHSTFLFTSMFVDRHMYPLKDGKSVSCLAVSMPEYMEETDRRNTDRFYVEETTNIPISFCPEHDPSLKYMGLLHNIAMDGIGVSIAFSGEIGLPNNQKGTLSVLSTWGHEVISIPVRYRYCKIADNQENAILGFQFALLSDTVEGSSILAAVSHLVSHLQASCRKELILA